MRTTRGVWLTVKLLVAVAVGIVLGLYAPEGVTRTVSTVSALYGAFLGFIIPVLLVAYTATGIAELARGAGRLVLATIVLVYFATVAAGSGAALAAQWLFPGFRDDGAAEAVSTGAVAAAPYFTVPLESPFGVASALVAAVVLGICLCTLRGRTTGDILYGGLREVLAVLALVVDRVLIPFLPLYVAGTFMTLAGDGRVVATLDVWGRVLGTVAVAQFVFLALAFLAAGIAARKNPLRLAHNQISGYLAAFGAQSSLAAIPVNLRCAEANGVCEQVRQFVVPLCAGIFQPGRMIALVCCASALLTLHGLPADAGALFPFILTMGMVLPLRPAAPGGAAATALPFLALLGLAPDSMAAGLLASLCLAQEALAAGCDASADNAVAVVIDKIYRKYICRQ